MQPGGPPFCSPSHLLVPCCLAPTLLLAGSIDVRTVEECALKGDEECMLALAVSCSRLAACSRGLVPACACKLRRPNGSGGAVRGAWRNQLGLRWHLAAQVYLRRIRKFLGAYLVHLGGRVDAIVFSAGEAVAAQWMCSHDECSRAARR